MFRPAMFPLLAHAEELPAQQKTLKNHQDIMDAPAASATPALYYMNNENELQQVVGLPDNDQLNMMMGPH